MINSTIFNMLASPTNAINDFVHIPWEGRLSQTPTKKEIPSETVGEGSGVSSRAM